MWFTGRGQNMNKNKSLEEVDSNIHGWLGGIKDFRGWSNSEMAEKTREWEVEPEDASELLQFHGGKKLEWSKKWFLEMEPIPGEDAVKECWNDNKEI